MLVLFIDISVLLAPVSYVLRNHIPMFVIIMCKLRANRLRIKILGTLLCVKRKVHEFIPDFTPILTLGLHFFDCIPESWIYDL